MKNLNTMPDVILDLTDESKPFDVAIAECEAARKEIKPWYRRIAKRIKSWF